MADSSSSTSTSSPKRLRVATYLTSCITIDFFEALLEYIEYKTKWQTSLLFEYRFEGPMEERGDVFADGTIDVAFMSAYGFLQLVEQTSFTSYELLPLSTIHDHPKGDNNTPGVFVDIVVNRNMKEINDFSALRGVRWAYNTRDKLTGCLTLQHLRSIGESASFFANVLKSRSHFESLRMILQLKAHASAVDANAFEMYLRENPDERQQLFRITTLGQRLPPYAIVVRKSMDEDMKRQLFCLLSEMSEDPMAKIILSSFKIIRIDRVTKQDILDPAQDLADSVKDMSFDTVYY